MTSNTILEAFLALSAWEIIATVLGIAYVVLAAKESIWCWPAAFISTLIYTVLFWEGKLAMSAFLNFYYMGMAVYGFLLWNKGADNQADKLAVRSWDLPKHISFIVIATLISVCIGYFIPQLFPDNKLPYLDATVMVFSVINTWLMAQKVLENWIYWIFIDAAAIYLYWHSGFYVTIIMFAVYLVLAVYGYKEWKESLQSQTQANKS